MNQTLASWCQTLKNIESNLKIVMWNNVKIPVSNMMCPVCNSNKDIKKLEQAVELDPECLKEYTQEILHRCHGWSNCSLSIHDNKVYHAECLKKKLGKKKFKRLLDSGVILVEGSDAIDDIDDTVAKT